MTKKKIAIIGATGFTGSELVRILHNHPLVEIVLITSESYAGKPFAEVHPFFQNIVDITLDSVDNIENYEIDLAFLALPHGVSMSFVEKFAVYDFPIVDLSGDFRLSSPSVYQSWYNTEHTYTQGFDEAVYGIPELYAEQIKKANLVANPGCYPTSVILGIAPLAKAGLINPSFIIADSKSGVTGAGVKPKAVNHFSSVNDNFKAYGLKHHRHSIEIQEQLTTIGGENVSVQFTPHLLPIDRGILSTIYLKPVNESFNQNQLEDAYQAFYKNSAFVRLLKVSPSVKQVRGTNYCDIFTTYDERTGNIIVISAIDNLVKGAAGQAIQNMNLLFGWEDHVGLNQIPVCP